MFSCFLFGLLQQVEDVQEIASHSEFILQSKDLEDISRDGCILILFESKMVHRDMEVDLLETELRLSVISLVIPSDVM